MKPVLLSPVSAYALCLLLAPAIEHERNRNAFCFESKTSKGQTIDPIRLEYIQVVSPFVCTCKILYMWNTCNVRQ